MVPLITVTLLLLARLCLASEDRYCEENGECKYEVTTITHSLQNAEVGVPSKLFLHAVLSLICK